MESSSGGTVDNDPTPAPASVLEPQAVPVWFVRGENEAPGNETPVDGVAEADDEETFPDEDLDDRSEEEADVLRDLPIEDDAPVVLDDMVGD